MQIDVTQSLSTLNRVLEQTRAVMDGINHLVMQQTPILLSDKDNNPIRLDSAEGEPWWNPSIVRYGNEYICTARSSNFYAMNDNQWVYTDNGQHRTVNRLYFLDNNFSVKHSAMIHYEIDGELTSTNHFGIEDIRLFKVAGKLYGIGACVNKGNSRGRFHIKQILLEFDGPKVAKKTILPSPLNLDVEKNWTPLVINDCIYFIYSHEPLVVYELLKGGRLKLISKQEPLGEAPRIRGGTPLIPWRHGYLCIVHNAPFTSDRCYYTHQFLRYDRNLRRTETSCPFFIQRRGIEFAAGLELSHNGNLTISYGVSDQAAYIANIPLSNLQEWLLV